MSMTKGEALERAQSAPEPVQTLLNELIARTFKSAPKAPKKKASKARKKEAPPPAPESGQS
jgi:hypothetical protein